MSSRTHLGHGRWLAAFALASTLLGACSSDDGGLPPGSDPEGDASASGDASPGSDASVKGDSAAPADASVDAGPSFSGEATYYAANGTGACGFPASPSDLFVAAMNKAQYSKSVCGKCVSVTGPKGTVKVRIVDLCPGCAFGGLDLSEQAFAKIAPLSAGRVKITWSFVPC
ncbi:MAG: extracellular endoglucanase precursor [Myxococcaceae bacterium]|nr:extracellular endoglucanase precursor [Myxococcaceae bacterium]